MSEQYFEKGHNIDVWIKCFYSLKKKSYEAKIEFARKQKNPVLKALIVSLAYEHLKLAETLKALFNIEFEEVDPFSSECKAALGSGVLNSIVEAKSIIRKIFSKEKVETADIEELMKMLRNLNDTTKGILLSLSKIANPPIMKVLVFLAETQDSFHSFVEKYLKEELTK